MSSSTSSFFAHRLAYALHASMIISKFRCHENETGSLYVGPLRKRSRKLSFRTILRSLSLCDHMEHTETMSQSRNKVGDSEKDFGSRVAADLLCS